MQAYYINLIMSGAKTQLFHKSKKRCTVNYYW